MNVTINNIEAVIAAVNCASNEETRFYMQGVQLDWQNKRAIATDGHRAAIIKLDFENHDGEAPAPMGLTTESVLKLAKLQKRGAVKLNGAATLEDGTSVEVKVLEGTFPDIDRVIETIEPGKFEAAEFNGAYLGTMERIGKAMKGKKEAAAWRVMSMTKNRAALFDAPEIEAQFLVMPRRF